MRLMICYFAASASDYIYICGEDDSTDNRPAEEWVRRALKDRRARAWCVSLNGCSGFVWFGGKNSLEWRSRSTLYIHAGLVRVGAPRTIKWRCARCPISFGMFYITCHV